MPKSLGRSGEGSFRGSGGGPLGVWLRSCGWDRPALVAGAAAARRLDLDDLTGGCLEVGAGAHRSTPAPLRDRLTMAEAMRLTTRVMTKRTKPQSRRSWSPSVPPEPKFTAMSCEMVDPPCWRMSVLSREGGAEDDGDGDGLLEGPTEPEHDRADHAPPPEGEDDGADHLPAAGAQGEGGLALPGGASEKTSRLIEATMGTIIRPTTSPAMKSEALSGGLSTLKNGMNAQVPRQPGAEADHVGLTARRRPRGRR